MLGVKTHNSGWFEQNFGETCNKSDDCWEAVDGTCLEFLGGRSDVDIVDVYSYQLIWFELTTAVNYHKTFQKVQIYIYRYVYLLKIEVLKTWLCCNCGLGMRNMVRISAYGNGRGFFNVEAMLKPGLDYVIQYSLQPLLHVFPLLSSSCLRWDQCTSICATNSQ